MSDSEYIKVYTGSNIIIQLMIQRMEHHGIKPIIKDETESGRLAGFGTAYIGQAEVYVHESELDTAVKIVETIRSETDAT